MTTTMTMTDAELVDVVRNHIEAQVGHLVQDKIAIKPYGSECKRIALRLSRYIVISTYSLHKAETAIGKQIGGTTDVLVSLVDYYDDQHKRMDVCIELAIYCRLRTNS